MEMEDAEELMARIDDAAHVIDTMASERDRLREINAELLAALHEARDAQHCWTAQPH